MKSLLNQLSFALFGSSEMRDISLGLIQKVLAERNMDGFQYRENEYFNDKDNFIFYDVGLKRCFISKVHKDKDKPSWFTNESLNYKCTSIPCYRLTPEKNFFH